MGEGEEEEFRIEEEAIHRLMEAEEGMNRTMAGEMLVIEGIREERQMPDTTNLFFNR